MADVTPEVDVLVVGAGVVGLAVAARIAEQGCSVLVVERHDGPGRETSSRNSEVIHAGIYYPPGSLRARMCVRGNRLLYELCERSHVQHRALGKLIVATSDEEIAQLEELYRWGQANGAIDLELLDRLEVATMEPNVEARAGLFSPSTGIVDAHGLVKALEAKTHSLGGSVVYRCVATHIYELDANGGYCLVVQNPAGSETLGCRVLVNAAGLESDRVAALAGIDRYQLHWCKGDYFAVYGRQARLVSRLVYPVPTSNMVGLGIHVTLDLAGRMRLGPDATYMYSETVEDREAINAALDVDPTKADQFWSAVRCFLPGLRMESLHPDIAGIRPKLQGPHDPWMDFVIQEESNVGRPGLVNLVGIDSPGLTSCLAIAEEVWDLVRPFLQ